MNAERRPPTASGCTSRCERRIRRPAAVRECSTSSRSRRSRLPIGSGWRPAPATSSRRQSGSRAWWRSVRRARAPLLGASSGRNGELVAILPLHVWRRRGLPVLRFAGHGPSDQLGPVCAPLTDPDVADAVGSAVSAIPYRRFVLLAELVPSDHRFGQLVGGRTLYTDESPLLRFDEESWDEFLRRRGANFRQQVRRFPRKLAAVGEVSFRLSSDSSTLDRDLDTLFALHRRRWQGAETPFLRMAGFHREMAARALERGWLRLWMLEVGGRPVAALYGFRFGGVESAYQGGRDPALARYPLGFILISHAVREALGDGMREYHLLRGGEQYKARFANTDRNLETSAVGAWRHCRRRAGDGRGGARPLARAAAPSRPCVSARRQAGALPV